MAGFVAALFKTEHARLSAKSIARFTVALLHINLSLDDRFLYGKANSGASATLAHGVGIPRGNSLAVWIVVAHLGLVLLRKAWINLDLIGAAALMITGNLTLIV